MTEIEKSLKIALGFCLILMTLWVGTWIWHQDDVLNARSEVRAEEEAKAFVKPLADGGVVTAISYGDQMGSDRAFTKHITIKVNYGQDGWRKICIPPTHPDYLRFKELKPGMRIWLEAVSTPVFTPATYMEAYLQFVGVAYMSTPDQQVYGVRTWHQIMEPKPKVGWAVCSRDQSRPLWFNENSEVAALDHDLRTGAVAYATMDGIIQTISPSESTRYQDAQFKNTGSTGCLAINRRHNDVVFLVEEEGRTIRAVCAYQPFEDKYKLGEMFTGINPKIGLIKRLECTEDFLIATGTAGTKQIPLGRFGNPPWRK
ncbi:MAG: hypothetical protein WCT32_03165 [Patescibacteria group bacterium]|jgi:hypothetical protein